jgi:hypothetical protein
MPARPPPRRRSCCSAELRPATLALIGYSDDTDTFRRRVCGVYLWCVFVIRTSYFRPRVPHVHDARQKLKISRYHNVDL